MHINIQEEKAEEEEEEEEPLKIRKFNDSKEK